MLVIAIVALHHPKSKSTTADTSLPARPSSSAPAGHSSSPHSPSRSTPPATQHGTSTTADLKAIPLVVLNNTTVTHLASDAATLFEQAGWKVTSAGNYQNDIASTCAYYDPSYPGALAAANLLQSEFPSIVRVKPKFTGLVAGPIVVVLTPDFTTA